MISVIIVIGPNDSPEFVKSTFTGAHEIIEVREGTIAQAQNYGAEQAQGDILLYAETDMDLGGIDVSTLEGDFDLATALYDTPHLVDKGHIVAQNIYAKLDHPWSYIGGFMWMRKKVWEALGGFRDTWWNDVEFSCRAFWRGFKYGHFDIPVIHTRPFGPNLPFPEFRFIWGVP